MESNKYNYNDESVEKGSKTNSIMSEMDIPDGSVKIFKKILKK